MRLATAVQPGLLGEGRPATAATAIPAAYGSPAVRRTVNYPLASVRLHRRSSSASSACRCADQNVWYSLATDHHEEVCFGAISAGAGTDWTCPVGGRGQGAGDEVQRGGPGRHGGLCGADRARVGCQPVPAARPGQAVSVGAAAFGRSRLARRATAPAGLNQTAAPGLSWRRERRRTERWKENARAYPTICGACSRL